MPTGSAYVTPATAKANNKTPKNNNLFIQKSPSLILSDMIS
jgi:hypothetical protein